MALTKAKIIERMCDNCGFTKAESTNIFESLLETIKKSLENGEDVLISGFGKFCVKEKKERRGRNPQTGEDLTLGARRIVSFNASGRLREKIN
ncbi:MAG: integration host factor subunit alpha, partial [bacterium]